MTGRSRTPWAGDQVMLRPVVATDLGVLREVYSATRTEELALVDWTEVDKQSFVGQQFDAQDRYYRQYYPGASFDVVLLDGQPIGRLYVDRWPEELRIIDIALLPHHRNGGVGTLLLQCLMDDAAASGRKVSIHVERFNPALRLYTRLGFVPVADRGVYLLMEWAPAPPAPSVGSRDHGLVKHAAIVRTEGDQEQRDLPEVVMAEGEGLLLDEPTVRGAKDEGEGDALDRTLPLLGRSVPGLLALDEHELERVAVGRDSKEQLPDERGERRCGQVLGHSSMIRVTMAGSGSPQGAKDVGEKQ